MCALVPSMRCLMFGIRLGSMRNDWHLASVAVHHIMQQIDISVATMQAQLHICTDTCCTADSQCWYTQSATSERKEKKRKEKKRKEKKRKDYAFQRQCNEKPSIIPGCPGVPHHLLVHDNTRQTLASFWTGCALAHDQSDHTIHHITGCRQYSKAPSLRAGHVIGVLGLGAHSKKGINNRTRTCYLLLTAAAQL